MRTYNATDAGLNLDRFPAKVGPDVGWIFLEGPPGWSMYEHAKADPKINLGPCPCCGSGPLRRSWYCLGCDHTGLDDRVKFPGLPVGSCLDPDWSAEPTVYVPDEDLAGGVEAKPVKIRRGVARARRKAG